MNDKVSTLKKWLGVLLFGFICLAALAFKFFSHTDHQPTDTPATAVSSVSHRANILWIDDNAIMFKQFYAGEWHDDEFVQGHSAENYYSAALGSETADTLIAIWSAQQGESVLLKYSIRNTNDAWSASQAIADQEGENLDSQVVFDSSGNCWVFWVSDEDGDDDIYMSTRAKGKWSPHRRVNPDNNVPDISPRVALTLNGDITVTWRAYDEAVSQYLENSHTINLSDGISKGSDADETTLADINSSSLTISGKRVYVHFPDNARQQSAVLDTR